MTGAPAYFHQLQISPLVRAMQIWVPQHQVPSLRRGGGLGSEGLRGPSAKASTYPAIQNTPPIVHCLSVSAGKPVVARLSFPLSLPLRQAQDRLSSARGEEKTNPSARKLICIKRLAGEGTSDPYIFDPKMRSV